MAELKKLKRLYHLEDEVVRSRADVFHGNLSDELAAFTLRFPWLDAAWLNDFGNAINAAQHFQTDFTKESEQKVLTGDVATAMNNSALALSTLNLYAQLAYPDDLSRQRVFGQDKWAAARYNQSKMKDALTLAFDLANKIPYKNDLTGKGMTQNDIDALQTIATQLSSEDTSQEGTKKERRVGTNDRIKLHNDVWKLMKMVSLAAELVHRDDAARLKQYRLYPRDERKKTIVIIAVKETATGKPAAQAQVKLTNTKLIARTTSKKGVAKFQSTQMPKEVDVSVTINGNTTTLLAQKTKKGGEVRIEIGI